MFLYYFLPGTNTVKLSAILIIIIMLLLLLSLVTGFLPGTSLELAVIPTAQVSSFTLQYFPYYV
jgi:uncharacterized membrane protein YgaE (UPF0421/DUF939 family)